MTIRTATTLAAAATLALAAAAPATAQRTERFEWSGALAAGKTVEIRNVDGAIRALPAEGSTVRIEAVKTGDDDDPSAVDVRVIETADGVVACAIHPGADAERRAGCRAGGDHGKTDHDDVRVDFTVRVPTGVRLVANTVNGAVEARGLKGDVSAGTVNGEIGVATTGTVQASSVNGSIVARGGTGTWSGTRSFTTVNGSIEVVLPAATSADLEGETVNGSVRSDFPVTIDGGEWGPRSFSGTIGSGGGTLRVKTVNGTITIRRG